MRFVTAVGWLWLAGIAMSMGPGPDYRAKYQALMRQHKQKEAQAVVAQWEKAQPQDPDLYVAKFNLLLGEAEVLTISTKTAEAGDLSIQDPKTGQGVGSIGGGGYNSVKLQQAMAMLRKGLTLAPDRLDIRFGLAKAAEYLGDPAQQYQLLKEALSWRQSATGKPWRWRDGNALPAPEEAFVTGSLEEYMVPYWQTGTAAGYKRGLALAELLLTYYPTNSLGYFNKGNYYAFTDNNAEAYKWFVQADKRNPNDPQNINNLLRISLNLKDKAAVKGYLARLCRYPDFKQDCQQYTAELQKL